PVRSITAITQVFGDGQKFVAVAVEYDRDIKDSGLRTSTFSVPGRTVTKAYTNTRPALAVQGVPGRYVIVEMSPDDSGAALWNSGMSAPATVPATTSSAQPSASGSAPGQGGPKVGDTGTNATIGTPKATVTQTGVVTGTDGSTIASSSATH